MLIDNALFLLRNQLAFLVISVPVILNTCSHGAGYGSRYSRYFIMVTGLMGLLCQFIREMQVNICRLQKQGPYRIRTNM